MTDAADPVCNTFPYRRPKAAAVAAGPTTGKPAHYRLSRETWAIILDEYRNGATVPELSERWRVSAHALRKRITVNKASKRDWGDRIAREQAEARAGEQAAEQAAAAEAETARLAGLFEPDGGGGPAPPLSVSAAQASSRAMRAGQWDEARALATLAESYSRLEARQVRGALKLEDIPLEMVRDLALNRDNCATRLLAIWGEDDPHPAKRDFWKEHGEEKMFVFEFENRCRQERIYLKRRIRDLEGRLGVPEEQRYSPPPWPDPLDLTD